MQQPLASTGTQIPWSNSYGVTKIHKDWVTNTHEAKQVCLRTAIWDTFCNSSLSLPPYWGSVSLLGKRKLECYGICEKKTFSPLHQASEVCWVVKTYSFCSFLLNCHGVSRFYGRRDEGMDRLTPQSNFWIQLWDSTGTALGSASWSKLPWT